MMARYLSPGAVTGIEDEDVPGFALNPSDWSGKIHHRPAWPL
jgi:hypothetical protein